MASRPAMRADVTQPLQPLQDLVDEFLVDAEGLDDVAEFEHVALVLRAPFDLPDTPPEVRPILR